MASTSGSSTGGSPPVGGLPPRPSGSPGAGGGGGGAGGGGGGGGGAGGGAGAAAAGVAGVLPAFGPFVTTQQYKDQEELIRTEVFDAPDGFLNRVPGVGSARAQDWLVANLDAGIQSMASDNTRLLLGTSISDVAASGLSALAIARLTKNPNNLIACMVLSVYVGYTVSREWIREYSSLGTPHLFQQFEINGRTASAPVNGMVKDGWVSTTGMNSTALHLLGHLIIESASGDSVLGKLKAKKGTVFNPPAAEVETEQAKIMRDYNKGLTLEDRASLLKFQQEFGRLIPLVNALFGAGGANVDAALRAATLVRIEEF